jgi:hypothetical protein
MVSVAAAYCDHLTLLTRIVGHSSAAMLQKSGDAYNRELRATFVERGLEGGGLEKGRS